MNNLKYLFLALIFAGCGGASVDTDTSNDNPKIEESSAADAAMDLSSIGIPLSVTVPAGSEMTKGMGNMEVNGVKSINYEVGKGQFKLDIQMDDETPYQEASDYLAYAKESAEEQEGYELISEEENGFIYKYSIEGDPDYSFYYLKMKNDRAIEFCTGLNLMSEYTLDEAKKMFAAAKASM